jgi:hypothetical protein
MECTRCGACCVAPDIAALDKPVGVRCPHLTDELLCGVYEQRPQVCRDYAADAFCVDIAGPDLDTRVAAYLDRFGLTSEAARNRAAGMTSMRAARRLPVLG